MIEILELLGLSILAVIVIIGMIRVVFEPYNGFVNMLTEIMLLDYLGDVFAWIVGCIAEIFDNDQ